MQDIQVHVCINISYGLIAGNYWTSSLHNLTESLFLSSKVSIYDYEDIHIITIALSGFHQLRFN